MNNNNNLDYENGGNSLNNSAVKGSQHSKQNRGHNYSKSGKNFLEMNMQVRPSKYNFFTFKKIDILSYCMI
jgi:hypothetical protein